MNKYQNQTPSPVTRHHHNSPSAAHLPHNHHQVSTPHHHVALHTHPHAHAQPPLPTLPPPSLPAALSVAVAAQQPLISNSLAIRQEIQRFESVHPSIYAIYDLIDLLPMPDAQIAQQIRDHVVCIEVVTPETRGLILNSQAKKAVKNLMQQMPCGWPEYGIPPLAPYTNENLEMHLTESVAESLLQMIRFRFDGLDKMQIKKLKISYTFKKTVKFHFVFNELKATADTINTDTFIDLIKELGLSVRYEGSGPLDFSLENLSISGQFKYKMPFIFGSIKIYKFECVVALGGVRSNIGGILGNGGLNEMINDKIEYMIPALINGNQKAISEKIENNFVPRVNAQLKGHKIWYLFSLLGNSNAKCDPAPAPWLAKI